MRGTAISINAMIRVLVVSGIGPFWVGKASTLAGSLATGMLSITALGAHCGDGGDPGRPKSQKAEQGDFGGGRDTAGNIKMKLSAIDPVSPERGRSRTPVGLLIVLETIRV
jgi:hypothetical protein